MKTERKQRLEAAGFKVGTTDEFLKLTADEKAMIDIRLALARAVRERRVAQKYSQVELARRLKSSQSRVAKLEAAETNVSFDLLVRALLSTGAKAREIGRVIAAA
ncbi:MAG: helix-turn-helix domain protein [Verrucomicrobia bacterium]|nr:helix-turn-helix domain protein [Verrucomicrobiota bacterium]